MLCLFCLLYRRLAATRLQLANLGDVVWLEDQQEDDNTSHRVKHFDKTFNANILWLEQPPIRYFF
jgi:hypothetical protein